MVSFFCCLLTRRAVEQTGLLDDNLFAYGEDNDYCLRLRRTGHRIGIALGAYVHHDHGATSKMFGADWKKDQVKKAQKYIKEKYALATA